jgi:DNA-binding XRE family transcriptional regulator
MAGLTLKQKREWAQLLYTREGMLQKEIAEKVGVSAQTITKWVAKYKWEKLKQSMLITREEQLRRLYMQLDELNTFIMNRDEGQRFANSKEADSISKLAVAIRTLESEANIADVVEVFKRFLNWMRSISPQKAQEIGAITDDFIRHILKLS